MTVSLVPVHIGLMGHIDHGKTELARALSEKTSTAGLDKHPQSQKRGITIDLGFTMFRLADFLVTLVDAPGHADLIRSVVAGANIIDTAILVVAADEGPKVQTGEHLVVLESLGIDSLVVAIAKTDLVAAEEAARVEGQMRSIVSDAGFRQIEFCMVSSKTGRGIDDLRAKLLKVLSPRPRDTKGDLLMPIDHAFPIRGHGTVATGTILRGSISVGDRVEIVPLRKRAKIRSIQTFGESRRAAAAGDRIGVNIPEIQHEEISRGYYICAEGSLGESAALVVDFKVNPLYKGRVTSRMVVNASVGMPTITALALPFSIENGMRVSLDEMNESSGFLGLVLKEPVPVEAGTKVLLLRSDLPPTKMRVVGSGSVTETSERMVLFRKKTRSGSVQRVRESDVLVEGLASKRAAAELIVGQRVSAEGGAEGVIREPFGTRGVVAVEFEGAPVVASEPVRLERFVEEVYRFG
jgi:selenocysteine-specific elongation factor